MRNQLLILLFLLSGPTRSLAQRNHPAFEFHASVNHPISGKSDVRTFYGGGFGANILFHDTSLVSFKTGLEFNYFHTWDQWIYSGHFSNETNIHYQYGVISIPAIVRFNFGKEFKLFVELGAYLGISVGGDRRSNYFSYDPYNGSSFNGFKHEDYSPSAVSFTPMLGFGGRFPLSDRIDLVLKPEFAFMKNQYEGDESLFNDQYFYARFCVGIHLKPKRK